MAFIQTRDNSQDLVKAKRLSVFVKLLCNLITQLYQLNMKLLNANNNMWDGAGAAAGLTTAVICR